MKRALLVEDDNVTKRFLTEALTLLGWQVTAVDTGKSAIQAAIDTAFDVLLLDINLPDISGIDILRAIRNQDDNASIDSPAIALTADNSAALHAKLKHGGFDATATKPLTIDTLERLLADATNVSSTQRNDARDASFWQELPIWDDDSALPTVGGNLDTLNALRKLMLDDLPMQRHTILSAPGSKEAFNQLHRLRAACGFCGAARLAHTVASLANQAENPTSDRINAFNEASQMTLNSRP